ncbi:MAG: gephyrin-like molybdotransferase Glp [Pirellulales bacterium]
MPPERHPNADVRMRGFAVRSPVDSVWRWLDQHLAPLPVERVPLDQAARRVLAESIAAPCDVPHFTRGMMDGYAVRTVDTQGASSYQGLVLKVVGQALPGQPFAGEVTPGTAVRIMTGAPLPVGADCVVPAEFTSALGDQIEVLEELTPGKHLGLPGEDVRQGETVLAAGRRLRPTDLGLLSSLGVNSLPVVRAPQVVVLITGNEILPSGTPPTGPRIADANGPMLAALVQRDGGRLVSRRMIPDDPQQISDALQSEADVILVSGGSSVGQEDHAPRLVAEAGELIFHGVAMRPSSPTGLGRIGNRLVFLLPGNPVSCLAAYDFFAGRAIRMLGGARAEWPYVCQSLPLTRKLTSPLGRTDYARVRRTGDGVEPLAISGAAILSSVARADGFVVVPENSEGFAAGSLVDVFLYD